MTRSWGSRLVMMSVLLSLPTLVAARQPGDINVTAEVSTSRVYVGEAFILQVRVEGASSAEVPSVPPTPGLEARFKGGQDVSQRSTLIVNGRRVDKSFTAYVMQFEVVATTPGTITIPPFDVRTDGRVFTTNAVTISAVPPQEDKDVRLRIEVDNPNPYVGEPIRLRLMLGLGRAAADAAFAVPGVEARFDTVDESSVLQQLQNQPLFEVLGAQVPATQGSSRFDGVEMTTYTAERVLVPRESGRITIGPATASVDLIERKAMSIFDRDQTRRAVVPSNPLALDVKPLPVGGKPANFNGLIGGYRIAARASPTEVNVGDPITVTIRVEGPLAASVPAPALERQANLVDQFRVASESAPGTTDGRARIFTRVLRALRADVAEIPPIELPYFDTKAGRYEVARSEAIPVKVRQTRVVTAADAEGNVGEGATPSGLAVEERAGGLRFNFEGPDLLVNQSFDVALAMSSPIGLAAVAGPPVIYATIAGIAFVRRRASANGPALRRKRAHRDALGALSAATGESSSVAAAVSAAIRRYIGAKRDRAGEGLTGHECAELIRAYAPNDADALAALLERCDGALYGGLPLSEAERLRDEAASLIDRLEAALGSRA